MTQANLPELSLPLLWEPVATQPSYGAWATALGRPSSLRELSVCPGNESRPALGSALRIQKLEPVSCR